MSALVSCHCLPPSIYDTLQTGTEPGTATFTHMHYYHQQQWLMLLSSARRKTSVCVLYVCVCVCVSSELTHNGPVQTDPTCSRCSRTRAGETATAAAAAGTQQFE